jgi:DDE superfamily endonuclease
MANPTVIKHFHDELKKTLCNNNLLDKPNYIFNVDETGLCVELKSGRVITKMGKRAVYRRTWLERGENTTLVCCVSASGIVLPTLIIFKGATVKPEWVANRPKNCEIGCSPSGWIDAALFLRWMK